MRWIALLACLSACKPSPAPTVRPPTIFDTPRVGAEAPKPVSDEATSPTLRNELGSQSASDFDARPWVTELPWEANYAQYASGQRIGYSTISVSASELNAGRRLHIIRRDVIDASVVQGGGPPTEMELEAFESNVGQLKSFSLKTNRGGRKVLVEASLQQQQLKMVTTHEDEKTQSVMDYPDNTWGVLGVQAMLMQQPMQAGENRSGKVFLPGWNVVAQVELTAGQLEPTPLAGGSTPNLLPIEVSMTAKNLNIEARNWVDTRGEIQKTLTLSNPKILTLRVDRATRLMFEAERKFAQWRTNSVECIGDARRLHEREMATYIVDANGIDPYPLISQTATQRVRSIGPRAVEVSVFSRPESDQAVQEVPIDAELGSSALVQAEHEVIADLARDICQGMSAADSLPDRLNAAVSARVQLLPATNQFTASVQTARSMQGDDQARAILLIALLRNRGIAARLASGLYVESGLSSRARFQTWVEAWDGSSWISLDPRSGARADVGHLRLHVSDLTEDNPFMAVLPALEGLQRLQHLQIVPQP